MPDEDKTKKDEVYVVLSDSSVVFKDNQKIRDAVFIALIDWYFKHQSFSGEEIIQCDGPLIDAPNVLADIADDIIKFDVRWDE